MSDEVLKYGDFEKGKLLQGMQDLMNNLRMGKEHYDRDSLSHDVYYAILFIAEVCDLSLLLHIWLLPSISEWELKYLCWERIHLISTSLNPPKGRKKEERNWICLNERDDGATSQEYEGDLHALEQICREVVAHVVTTAPMSDITAVPTTGDPYAEPR